MSKGIYIVNIQEESETGEEEMVMTNLHDVESLSGLSRQSLEELTNLLQISLVK